MKKITQIKIITLSVLLILSSIVSAKLNKPTTKTNLKTKTETGTKFNNKLNISPSAQKKVGGLLLKRTLSKRFAINAIKSGKVLQQKSSGKLDREIIAVYLTRKPTKLFDEKLESLGIKRKNKIWIPAVADHKYGFVIYIAPIDKIETLAKMPEIMRIESLEQTYNGQLAKVVSNAGLNALAVWGRFDYYGQGLTVGIIDTGYDVGNPDLPDPVEKWSYSSGNLVVNADVTDTNSGHGTYIAGCIVGNGTLASANNLMNMNGIAPSSQVHVVKADTVNEGIRVFSSVTLIQALNDLAESNCVDVINMSLGGWDAYHDGSSPLDQAVDYVSIEKGIPVFCAAGNLANKKQHTFFEIEKFEAKELKFTVSVTNFYDYNSVAFNLIWADGFTENKHELFYDRWDVFPQIRTGADRWPLQPFDGSPHPSSVIFPDGNLYLSRFEGFKLDSTPSPRGEVQQQWYGLNHATYWEQDPADYWELQERTVRLCLTNKTATNRWFHLYIDKNREDSTYKKAKYSEFDSASSKYTVTSPGTADRAFTVGSFISRFSFENSAASNTTTEASDSAGVDSISIFSGQGPRVDQTNLREEDEYTYKEVQFEHVKPDFVCPGELVISVFDRNIRDSNVYPPLYAFTNTTQQLWNRSQPYASDYYIDRKRDDYTNLNYICPLGIFGGGADFWKPIWWSSFTSTDFISKSEQLGTSPASAFGAGSAILMLQAWPCFQIEELRRYMRPCEQTEFFPHNPGNYNIKRGFGNLHLGDIFLNNYYIDKETFLNYLSLVPNSKTNIVIENDNTIWVTNNPIYLAGNYQAIYCADSFCLTNFDTGWSKKVNYVNLTNRIWWADNVVLSNYFKQKIGVCLNLKRPDGTTENLDENIWVWHRHGLTPPVITITAPTNTSSIKFDPPINSFNLAGVWSDDSDVKTTAAIKSITWLNNTTGEGGSVSNINTVGDGGAGTWDAGTISIENPSYNVITVTAIDDDDESSNDSIVIDNGSRQFVVDKLKFKVNLAKPAKDSLKIQGLMKSTANDAIFEPGDEFYINMVLTNGLLTNLVTFVTTADDIKAKGRKAVYSNKENGHKFSVVASRKKNDDDIKLKITMKKFDGLENYFGITPIDAKKKDSIYKAEIVFKGKAGGYIFNSSKIAIPYWGKPGKNIIGKY